VGWVAPLHGAVIGLDTAPLIYFIESHPVYAPKVEPLFTAADRGDLRIVTSFVTLLEVLVLPLRTGKEDLANEYRNILLRSRGLTTVPIGQNIVEEAARLRAVHNLRTPDAIQLSTAICSGALFFVTNDGGLPAVPPLSLIVLDKIG
jgi:predicted nucleic acid-binding protein